MVLTTFRKIKMFTRWKINKITNKYKFKDIYQAASLGAAVAIVILAAAVAALLLFKRFDHLNRHSSLPCFILAKWSDHLNFIFNHGLRLFYFGLSTVLPLLPVLLISSFCWWFPWLKFLGSWPFLQQETTLSSIFCNRKQLYHLFRQQKTFLSLLHQDTSCWGGVWVLCPTCWRDGKLKPLKRAPSIWAFPFGEGGWEWWRWWLPG